MTCKKCNCDKKEPNNDLETTGAIAVMVVVLVGLLYMLTGCTGSNEAPKNPTVYCVTANEVKECCKNIESYQTAMDKLTECTFAVNHDYAPNVINAINVTEE